MQTEIVDTKKYIYKEKLNQRKQIEKIFNILLVFSILVGLFMLTVLLIDVAIEGGAWLRPELLTNYHSRKPENAGMKSAIVGSLIVIGLTGLFSFPLGSWRCRLFRRVRTKK